MILPGPVRYLVFPAIAIACNEGNLYICWHVCTLVEEKACHGPTMTSHDFFDVEKKLVKT